MSRMTMLNEHCSSLDTFSQWGLWRFLWAVSKCWRQEHCRQRRALDDNEEVEVTKEINLKKIFVIQPARWERRAVTGRRCPYSGEGRRLFDRSTNFFYKNCCNSGTESEKIDPKVGNERSLRGLQMGHWPKLGSYGKNRIFGPKNEILGPKKRIHFFNLTMFWPRPEKVVQRKKVPLPK